MTGASHGRQDLDFDHCRGLHLRSLVFDPDTKTKEQGLSAMVTESLSLSKKSSENWAFSFGCGKIKKNGRKSEGNAGNRTDEQR